jgi:hypothetical protein
MADPFNPYAPPAAELDTEHQVGGVFHVGKLVRMDRNGSLPGRCVACNAPAESRRVARTLYWARWEWRLFIWILPPALLGLAAAGLELAGMIFIPAVLVLIIANVIIRRRMDVAIGLCARHWRMRRTLGWLGVAASLSIFPLVIVTLRESVFQFLVPASMLATLALGIAYAYTGAQRVAIYRLDARHVWLKGAGRGFCEALPEPPAE